jgi:hypothetical protein
LTVAPGGSLFAGSASSPFAYKVRPGSTTAEKFVDAGEEGAGRLFLRHDCRCRYPNVVDVSVTPVGDTKPVKRHTALRGFDLSTGAPKLRWNLPGENNTCNDFSIGPDRRFRSATPPTAESTSYRPVLPPPNFSW